jgi:hypothetical protein
MNTVPQPRENNERENGETIMFRIDAEDEVEVGGKGDTDLIGNRLSPIPTPSSPKQCSTRKWYTPIVLVSESRRKDSRR